MRLFRPYPVLKRVIVNTKTAHAFRGVMWGRRGSYLVLRSAEMLGENGSRAPIDGELIIDADNVDFIQVLQ